MDDHFNICCVFEISKFDIVRLTSILTGRWILSIISKKELKKRKYCPQNSVSINQVGMIFLFCLFDANKASTLEVHSSVGIRLNVVWVEKIIICVT